MGKLISAIHNYPLSDGAVAYSNKLLLEDGFYVRTDALKDYLKTIFELSKDIYFFNDLGTNSNTWNDLLKKDIVFQLSRFVTISARELHDFFTALPQINGFSGNVIISDDEYRALAYQRFQVIQYLFWFYKTIGDSVNSDALPQILSILKSDTVNKLFIRYQALANECLNKAPVLIPVAQRIAVPAFRDIAFPTVSNEFTIALALYYNPTNNPGSEVLTIYGDEHDQVKAANEYAYVIFKALMQVQQSFTNWATNKLQELTTTNNTHEPHIALLIVFSKLAMFYDAQYNKLIHKNTAFVFNDILQLKRQQVLPDMAYVNIELAKNINQYFLAKNTLFKAGKNNVGKTVYYQSTKDIVLNGAKISYLKSSVRVKKLNTLFTVTSTDDAANPEWQANHAWPPFNDMSESYTGIGIESKMLSTVQKKDTLIDFVFEFSTDLPIVSNLAESLQVTLLMNDDSEVSPAINTATTNNKLFTIQAKIEKDLKISLRTGVNVRIRMASPARDSAEDDPYFRLYQFLLKQAISTIKVKLQSQTFIPAQVQTSYGAVDGNTSFAAFGAQSLSGASFRIEHPFIRYANKVDITINWGEALKVTVPISIGDTDLSLDAGTESSTIDNFNNLHNASLRVRLRTDHSYLARSVQRRGTIETFIDTTLPRILMVKSIELTADLEESVYVKENSGPLLYIETISNRERFVKSLLLPFANKRMQRNLLFDRHQRYRQRQFHFYFNNLTAHLYPFGEKKVNKSTGLTFLPDYTLLGFNGFEGDLYIGLTNIKPGQSISLLFDIAEETAAQSELEARITWYFISSENFEAIDPSRVTDTTNNFLQSGIVQLTLPDTATHSNDIIYGKDTYWLIARCDRNYEVTANIKSVKTNGVAIERLFDLNNQDAKKSVAPGTIEQLFPKTANIKSVTQHTPSLNGRETETDAHYFWRSSQRLRHKQRGINQWDIEQLILEQFSFIYKVKCLNHAWYDDATVSIIAKPAHVLVTLIPHYIVNPGSPNFQPAIPMSRLSAIKTWLKQKTSPFLQFQVLNAHWDAVTIELEAVLNENILDQPYYRDLLNADIQRFFSPWAFDTSGAPVLSQKIFATTLIDFIDELSYVHHIKSMRILKNNVEANDEINVSSPIHILTSSTEHNITALLYGS